MSIRHLPFPERFHAQYVPEPNSGCWLWTGAVGKTGYGHMRINYKQLKAHRVSYEMYKGPIPDGLQIDHLCRVTICVNPAHLEAVTGKVNCQRGLNGDLRPRKPPPVRVPRQPKSHCSNGHAFTEENTGRDGGTRYCRICKRAHYNRWFYERGGRAQRQANDYGRRGKRRRAVGT